MAIRVKKIATGEIGTLRDDSKFDPNKFEMLDDQTIPQNTDQNTTQPGQGSTGGEIDPNLAAFAQVLFPGAVGDAIKTRYDIQEKQKKETSTVTKDPLSAQKKVALDAVGVLENRFGRGDASNVGTKGDLALSEGPGYLSRLSGFLKKSSAGALDPKLKEDINIFKNDLAVFLPVFTQAFGSGAPQEGEAKRLIEAAPGAGSTNEEAKAWFSDVKILLGEIPKQEEVLKKNDVTDTSAPVTESPNNEEKTNPALNAVIKGAPLVGGILGGVLGAGVGAVGGVGVGAIPGGAIGTGIGTMAGTGVSQSIENILGTQKKNEQEQVKELVVDSTTAAALDVATAGLFKVGGKLFGAGAKSIGKGLAEIGDNIALKAIRPSPSQQTKFLAKTGQTMKSFSVEKGLFEKGVEQVDTLIGPMQESFDDIAIKSGRRADYQAVLQNYDDVIAKFSGVLDESGQTLAKGIETSKELFIKKFAPLQNLGIDVGELTQARRDIDKLIPESSFLKDELAAGRKNAIRDILQDSVRQATDGLTDASGRSLKDMGEELSKLYSFRGIAEQQQFIGKGGLPIGLLKQIGLTGAGGLLGGGAGGLFSGGDPKSIATGLLVGVGLPAAVNNPKVIAVLAKQLPNIGEALMMVPQKQRIQFLTDSVRRLLTNIGAASISGFGETEEQSPPEPLPFLK